MSGISVDTEFESAISGSFTAVAQTVELSGSNTGIEAVQLTGTWTGTIVAEASNDGSNWIGLNILKIDSFTFSTSIATNGMYLVPGNGYLQVRLRSSTWTTGTASINAYGRDGVSILHAHAYLRGPDGTAIGNALDRLKTIDGLRNGGTHGSMTLTTANTAYEAKVGGSRLANRKSLTITAMDDMFWGYDSSVTTATGTPLYKNQQIVFAIDPDSTFQVWLIAGTNSKTARITESL